MKDITVKSVITSYIVFVGLPLAFIVLGLFASARINIGISGFVAFFFVPSIFLVTGFLFLFFNRLTLSDNILILERFVISKLRYEKIVVELDSIKSGVLSNNYRKSRAVQSGATSMFMPVSFLYIEYYKGHNLKKIVYNVANFNNNNLLFLVRNIPKIDSKSYRGRPSF